MEKKGIYLFCIPFCLALLLVLPVRAQQKVKVNMLASAQKNRILLRWAVDDAATWKLAHQFGYRLERYTVVKDKKLLAMPEKVIIADTLKPRPLPAWNNLIVKDSIAAIVAYAIHGQTFTVSGNGKSQVEHILAGSEELEQRYAFSLFAAERSFAATEYAGWGLADTTAKQNEKYLYRIFCLIPKPITDVDSASVFIGLGDYEALPRPIDIVATFKNRQAAITWNENTLRNHYSAYHVERSADGGKTFLRLTKQPFFNANASAENNLSKRTIYLDSLPDNITVYQYRILGVTAFGETGPASAVLTGKGKLTLDFAPDITVTRLSEEGYLEVEWDIDKDVMKQVKGFRLNYAENIKGPYETVVNQIAADQRKLVYKKPAVSNYFTISAYTADNTTSTSFPVFVQLPDSIPPQPPAALTGKIDTTGVVILSWKPNSERDLLGYRIFKKNNLADEFVPATDSICFFNKFKDTVSLNVLNDKIYYSLIAIDKRFNESGLSETLELKRPDKIAPNMPVITGYKVTDKTISISWARTSDRDLYAWLLYRKEGRAKWQLFREIKDSTFYSDAAVKSHQTYQYYLVSKDKSGLLSPPSKILELSLVTGASSVINKLDAYVDRSKHYIQLFWSGNLTDVEQYYVYRAEGDNPVSLYTILPAGKKQLVDEKLKVNTNYHYVIRALFKSGDVSVLKEIKVNY